MINLPLYIPVVFVLTAMLTLFFLYKGSNQSKFVVFIVLLWLAIQAWISLTGFYTVTDPVPPRFVLLIGPPLLVIVVLFLTQRGRALLDSWSPQWLTWLHLVRVPVELVLFWLFMHKQVPQLMTFEGRNFDILSGVTAPIVAWLGYARQRPNKTVLLIWNILCVGLLLNIVIHAILSAPFPFQRLAFDQPNVAVLYFPFTWLPGFIVPAVLLAHLAVIRNLLKQR
jgi:hypothetical protein